MRNTVLILAAAAVLFFPVYAAAQSDGAGFSDETEIILDENIQPEGAPGEPEKLLSTWDIVRVIIVLAAVVAIIYGIFYVLKKAGGTRFQNNNLVKVIASQSLTQNASVHVIEVGGSYILVGCGDNGVNKLADIEDKDTIDSLKLASSASEAGGKKTFSDFLGSIMGSDSVRKRNMSGTIGSGSKILGEQRERLKKM